MEVAVEDAVGEPARDKGAPHGCHLLLSRGDGRAVDVRLQPGWQGLPVLAHAKGKLRDEAVEPRQAHHVLIVVERGARLRHALRGQRVLELFHLLVLVKVVALHSAVLFTCRRALAV